MNRNIPDIDLDRIRDDFEDIFLGHFVKVTRYRSNNTDAGNYGSFDEDSGLQGKDIEICIQGSGSDDYKWAEFGKDTSSKSWNCLARYNVDLINDDIIIFNLTRFRVIGMNRAIKGVGTNNILDSIGFIEFKLQSIDKEDVSFYN
jgi:hypothetical protein